MTVVIAIALAGCSSSTTSTPTSSPASATTPPSPTTSTPSTDTTSPTRSTSPSTAVVPKLKIIDVCTEDLSSTLPTIEETTPPSTDPTIRGIVAYLQKNLPKLGYKAGSVTGVYDAKTIEAVKKFQADRNITVDGVVGTETWDRWFIDACGID